MFNGYAHSLIWAAFPFECSMCFQSSTRRGWGSLVTFMAACLESLNLEDSGQKTAMNSRVAKWAPDSIVRSFSPHESKRVYGLKPTFPTLAAPIFSLASFFPPSMQLQCMDWWFLLSKSQDSVLFTSLVSISLICVESEFLRIQVTINEEGVLLEAGHLSF